MNKLHFLVDQFESDRVPHWDQWASHLKILKEIKLDLKRDIKKAVCFDIGSTDDLDGISIIPELCKLPYECCWFETNSYEKNYRLGYFCKQDDDGAIRLSYFQRKINESTWSFLTHSYFQISACDDTDKKLNIEATIFPLAFEGKTDNFFTHAFTHVAAFLSALNCTNVVRDKHTPDIALQKARAKRGKLPLFETWTLTIGDVGQATQSDGKGVAHISRRLHLCRGHARQYETGKWCWVRAHVKGNKSLGVIHKDYLAKFNQKGKGAAT